MGVFEERIEDSSLKDFCADVISIIKKPTCLKNPEKSMLH